MQDTDRQYWQDLVRLTKEYWVEVIIFFLFVAAIFAIGIYLF